MKNLHPLHINPLAILKTSNSKSNPNNLNETKRQIILFQSSKKGRLPNSSCHLPKSAAPWGRLATRKTNTLGRQKAKQHLKSDLENVLNERWHGKMTSPWCGQTKTQTLNFPLFYEGEVRNTAANEILFKRWRFQKSSFTKRLRWMSGAFLKLKRAMPSSFGVPLRPADVPHIPPPPCTYIPHTTFFTHFPVTFTVTFSWPLARAWCIDPQCAPSHTQLKVWQSSVHTPMHWICSYM